MPRVSTRTANAILARHDAGGTPGVSRPFFLRPTRARLPPPPSCSRGCWMPATLARPRRGGTDWRLAREIGRRSWAFSRTEGRGAALDGGNPSAPATPAELAAVVDAYVKRQVER